MVRVHLSQNINKHCHTDHSFDKIHKRAKAIKFLWLGFVKIVTEARGDDEIPTIAHRCLSAPNKHNITGV
jgi:hypothetical protein